MPVIAIVDDQNTNRQVFTMLAKSVTRDTTAEAFADPNTALAWIAHHRPDLIITDYRMPGMDGADFTRSVRAIAGCAATPILVITAYDDPNFRIRALEAGATGFLQTPIKHAEFQNQVRDLLDVARHPFPPAPANDQIQGAARAPGAPPQRADLLAQVIDTMPVLVHTADPEGYCRFANAAYARHVGRGVEQCAGLPMKELTARDQIERDVLFDRLVFERGAPLPSYEENFIDRDGVLRTQLTTKSPLRNSIGEVVNVLTTSLDITDQKSAQRHLHHLARHDVLTDLPNRSLLAQRIEEGIERAARSGRLCALHFLDLDRFKNVNDSLGHDFGDQLLITVARILRMHVGEHDTVARLGGDEFAILQEGISDPREAATLADSVGHVLAEPIQVRGHRVNISASIGITVCGRDSSNIDELLKNADLAMYQAKAEGRHGYRFFRPDLRLRLEQAQSLEAGIREGVANGQFVLHYQPQVSLHSGQVIGLEALLRWNRPGHGLCAPADFLNAAEDGGLIVLLTEWVLNETCTQIRRWETQGLPPLRVAINVSPNQFRRQDVHRMVMQATQAAGIDPSRLELELTEGVVMDRSASTAQTLDALRRDGVSVALDDFGTGFSCLDYLRHFRVNRIKIDRSFIQNLPQKREDAAIVCAIIGLARGLGVTTVAEGVENPEILDRLRQEGCDEAQGFYLGRPVPAGEWETWFRRLPSLRHPLL